MAVKTYSIALFLLLLGVGSGEGFIFAFLALAEGHILVLAIHVNDCAFTGSSSELIAQYKTKINEQYALTNLGPIHWLLGIKIIRDRSARMISLSQSSYINSILRHFGLEGVKACNTTMVPGAVYSRNDSPQNPADAGHMKNVPYREATV